MKILAVCRDHRYSPNSVDKDFAILKAAAGRLGGELQLVGENDIVADTVCDICLSMAREEKNLHSLSLLEQRGVRVVNSPESVLACRRSNIENVMRELSVPLPPSDGVDGFWIKRGDAAAQSQGDVRYCRDAAELELAKEEFSRRGINDFTVSAHVAGDLVKWYAVEGGFFRYYYPTDDGNTKFNDEAVNGDACHYRFDAEALRLSVEKVARAIGITVYGGDALVRSDGSFCIIDFNDWPSFSRCKEDAADAIASFVCSSAETICQQNK